MSIKNSIFVFFCLMMLSACGGHSEKNSGTADSSATSVSTGSQTSGEVQDEPGSPEVEKKQKPDQSHLQDAPDFALKDLKGNIHRLSDYCGRVVIIDFWATYCPPCKKEIPHFIELQEEYGDKGLTILGIALDAEYKVRKFYEEHKINYPVLLSDGKVTAKYGGIKFIPTTFIVSPEGKILNKYIGYRSKETFLAALRPYLSEE